MFRNDYSAEEEYELSLQLLGQRASHSATKRRLTKSTH